MSNREQLNQLNSQLGPLVADAESLEQTVAYALQIIGQAIRICEIAIRNAGIKLQMLEGSRYPFNGLAITLTLKEREIRLVYDDQEKVWGFDYYPGEYFHISSGVYMDGVLCYTPHMCVLNGLTVEDLITIIGQVVTFLTNELRPQGKSPTEARLARLDELAKTLADQP